MGVKISVTKGDISSLAADTWILPLHKTDNHALPVAAKKVDARLGGAIRALVKSGDFSCDNGSVMVLHSVTGVKAARIVLVGLGEASGCTTENCRRAAALAAAELQKLDGASAAFALPESGATCGTEANVVAVAEGILLRLYTYNKYRKKKKAKKNLARIQLVCRTAGALNAARAGAKRAVIYADAVCLARDLGNTPGADVTPSALAAAARKAARAGGFKCRVLSPAEMKKLGMGCILGVAKGSRERPAMVIMEYGSPARGKDTLVYVGKGITFDTGGISLKPGGSMHEMKYDKCGACAVIGAMQAIARLKPRLHVVGILACAENMPGGAAVKPGDVLTAMNGTTIEVWNTDAEGRLVLADALSYAQRYKPAAIVDLATLTGAVIVGLGHECAAVIGNDETFGARVKAAGDNAGDPAWQLPLWKAHEEQMKGEIADMKNIGNDRSAGSITAAAFLKAFAGDAPWAHVDIAGVAWGMKRPYIESGASGYGVRMLAELARTWND